MYETDIYQLNGPTVGYILGRETYIEQLIMGRGNIIELWVEKIMRKLIMIGTNANGINR